MAQAETLDEVIRVQDPADQGDAMHTDRDVARLIAVGLLNIEQHPWLRALLEDLQGSLNAGVRSVGVGLPGLKLFQVREIHVHPYLSHMGVP